MNTKPDVYTKVTNQIIADLERGNLTWLQPWQSGHAAGHISRPLRAGGKAYRGVNVLMLWASAMESGFNSPLCYMAILGIGHDKSCMDWWRAGFEACRHRRVFRRIYPL